MINQKSVEAVSASKFGEHFTKPLYNSYCFSNIPQTIINTLTGSTDAALPQDVLGSLGKSYKKVVLFFVDGFGWRFFEKYHAKYPFLSRIVEQGVVSKLTSQFPSTTPVHVSTIHTGLPVGQHGTYEWFYYEPIVDAVIAPLLFSFAGDKERETLLSAGLNPHDIFPDVNVYKTLAKHGVRSYVYQQAEFTPSPFGNVVFEGAEVYPYNSLEEALNKLAGQVKTGTDKEYHFFYCDMIDHQGHVYGPTSPEFDTAVDIFFTAAEAFFYQVVTGNIHDTLFLMTADHGHMEIDPATTFYVDKQIPEIVEYIKTNAKGTRIAPIGSCRDLFLHIKEGKVAEARELLHQKMKDIADVQLMKDMIDNGFFGKPSATFLSRAADIVILPYARQSVWWSEGGKYVQKYFGHHGGLSKEEMETDLFAFSFE